VPAPCITYAFLALQVERILHNVRSYENPLEKYVAVMDLQVCLST
jgi:hypothetical protein